MGAGHVILSFISRGVILPCACTLFCIYSILIIIYRLVFHPLAKFPGPKLAAATKWYEFYFDLIKAPGGQFSKEVERMHNEYGPIVRINPDEIHVRDPTWYDVLYAPNPTYRNKYPPAAKMAGTDLGTFGTVEHDIHRKRRAANAPLFSKRAIREAQGLIRPHVEQLASLFAEAMTKDKPVELHTTFLAFTTDTLCHYTFNMNFGLMDDPAAARGWRKTMKSVAEATPLVKQFPWLLDALQSLPRSLLTLVLPDVTRLLNVHTRMEEQTREYLEAKIDQQVDPSTKNHLERPKTIFHAIDRSSLPPHEKVRQRLQQEGATVLLAGGDTTARVLTNAMFHLLSNPEILEKVRGELIETRGASDEIPDLRTLESLPWLAASIRESLRLPSVSSSRFPLTSNTELVYGKWVIPAKTPVSMTPASVLQDPIIYPEPMKFVPGRWLQPTEQANRCFVPFGKGTRMCQGMDFAYAEMYLAIATLLTRFNFELFNTYRERDIDHIRDCFLGEPDPASPGVYVKVMGKRELEFYV